MQLHAVVAAAHRRLVRERDGLRAARWHRRRFVASELRVPRGRRAPDEPARRVDVHRRSASVNATAWKWPIGLPNALRVSTYSRAISKAKRERPTARAATTSACLREEAERRRGEVVFARARPEPGRRRARPRRRASMLAEARGVEAERVVRARRPSGPALSLSTTNAPRPPQPAGGVDLREDDEAIGERRRCTTNAFLPVSSQPSPSCVAIVEKPARSLFGFGSPHATAPKRAWPPSSGEIAERARAPARSAPSSTTATPNAPGPPSANAAAASPAAELLLEEHARRDAEPAPPRASGKRDEAEADLVGDLPDVVRDAAEPLELADPRRERALRELRHAVQHERLILGGLEADHRGTPWVNRATETPKDGVDRRGTSSPHGRASLLQRDPPAHGGGAAPAVGSAPIARSRCDHARTPIEHVPGSSLAPRQQAQRDALDTREPGL